MSEPMQAMREDLAYLREMAASDEPAAARKAGLILATGGVVFASASLAAWAGVEGYAAAALIPYVWWGALLVFAVFLALVLMRSPKSQGVRDRATGVAWAAIGGVIFTAVIGFQVAADVLQTPAVFAGLPTVVLALYGAGWTVAAAMSGRRWMTAVALGGHVGAVVIAFLVRSPVIFVAYAAALLLLATAPGIVLLQRRG